MRNLAGSHPLFERIRKLYPELNIRARDIFAMSRFPSRASHFHDALVRRLYKTPSTIDFSFLSRG
jgi:hypothetical protein